MQSPALPQTHADVRPATAGLRTAAIVGVALIFSLLTLYAVFMGQGTLLHEFAHDGRHLFGAPCH